MNVTFLSPRSPELKIPKLSLLAGFCSTLLLHGLLDYLPHSYPIKPAFDVSFALVVFAIFCFLAKPPIRPLLAACFLGCIFPDLVDLAPSILSRHLGLHLTPKPNFFPWHWKRYSGSIYDGTHATESLVYHLLVSALFIASLWRRRDLYTASPPV